MATVVAGNTLLLSKLGIATGQGTYSMGAAAGSTATPISMSAFAIDTVSTITGYTYVVESTAESYALTFTGAGGRFGRISNAATNFTWTVNFAGANSTNYFTIGASPTANGTLTAGNLNPQDPSGQSSLLTIREHLLSVTFADDYNDHIGSGNGYNVARTKTIYVVDTYDGNTALCLTADSPITMADGTILEVGDLEQGDLLKGFSINGLGDDSDANYLEWSTISLETTPKIVKVVNVVFSFADKIYSINDGEVRGTFEHPMLVKDSIDGMYRFKKISQILVGDFLIKEVNDSVQEIEVLSVIATLETEEIVSIDVEKEDTYLVNGYLTHNKGGDSHTDLTAPAAPTGLSWNNTTDTLTWNAVAGASAYDVQIDDVDFSWATLLVDATEWSTTTWSGTLSNGTRYARVRAIDHGLAGAWSATLTFTQS
jgi:hypothetical protein